MLSLKEHEDWLRCIAICNESTNMISGLVFHILYNKYNVI